MERLAGWPGKFRIVGDIRGRGLMIGIEIVTNQNTKERAQGLRDAIVDAAFQQGLLILGSGENTLRLCPPLVIDEQQADFAIRTLENCLADVEKHGEKQPVKQLEKPI